MQIQTQQYPENVDRPTTAARKESLMEHSGAALQAVSKKAFLNHVRGTIWWYETVILPGAL